MLIKVKVFPNSKKEEIIKKTEDSFEVRVRAKPIRGLANKAVIKILSRYFKVPQKNVVIISGLSSRQKLIKI